MSMLRNLLAKTSLRINPQLMTDPFRGVWSLEAVEAATSSP